jgi:predicted PurR-regulated permease PerM
MTSPRDRALYGAVLFAAGLLVLGLLFHELVTLLLAVLMTVLISIPLAAAADRLERYRVPRPLGALAGLLLAVGVIALVVWALIPPFIDETNEFIDEVPAIVDDLTERAADITGGQPEQVGEDVKDFLEGYTEDPERFIGPLTSIGLSVVAVVGALIFMILTAYYIAVRPRPLIDAALSLFPPPRREEARRVMNRLRTSWVGWMEGVVIDMLVTGVLLFIGLSIIGLDFAVFFAVLSALLVVIPYFGAIVGAVPPTLFALTDSVELALLSLAVYVLVQQIEGNVIIPLVMAQRVKLHPAAIAVGVVVVGQLFGLLGLFVAVPLISMAIILSEELWVRQMEERHGVRPAAPLEPVTPEAVAAREGGSGPEEVPEEHRRGLPVQ